jgi:hypothetical protein
VTGGDEGAVPEPGLPTPVAPPMTPPVVGGFAAPIASLAGGSAVPDAAELFTEASFVGAPPPTAAPPAYCRSPYAATATTRAGCSRTSRSTAAGTPRSATACALS